MLIKSVLRLKTYVAVLLISLIIFSISIPLSITLAQGYGESRAKIYGELLRPNAVLEVNTNLNGEALRALYILLLNETPNSTLTLKERISLNKEIYNLTIESWLESSKNNPVFKNASNPIYHFNLGGFILYDYDTVDLSNVSDPLEADSLIRAAHKKLSINLNNLLIQLAKQHGVFEELYSTQQEYYYGYMPDVMTISFSGQDANTTIVIGSIFTPIDVVVVQNVSDLWHKGYKTPQEVSKWSNVIFVDNKTRIILQLYGIYKNGTITIGNNTFKTILLEKDTSRSGYWDIGYDLYFYGKLPVTLYVSETVLSKLLKEIAGNQQILNDSLIGTTLLSLYYYQSATIEFARSFAPFFLDSYRDKILTVISPYLIAYNGYSNTSAQRLINQTSEQISNITGLQPDIIYSAVEAFYNNDLPGTSRFIMNVLIEYNSVYIYSSPTDEVYDNVNGFYLSLIDRLDWLKGYISDLLNQTNTSEEPFKSLYETGKGEDLNEITTYPVTPYYGGPPVHTIMYDQLLGPGIRVYGIYFILSSDRVSEILMLRAQSWDPIGAMSLVSLVPVVILLGYTIASEALSLIIVTSRRWLAVSLTRGAYLKKFFTRLKVMLTGLGVTIAILGIALSGLLSMKILGIRTDILSYITSQYKSLIVLLPTILLVPFVTYMASRNSLKQIEDLSPLEAVRPIESVEKAATSRRRAVGSLLIIIFTIISLTLGITRPNVDDLFDQLASSFGGAGVALLGMLLFGGIMISPFVPLIVIYYVTNYLTNTDCLFRAVDRFIGWLFVKKQVGSLAINSSYRIRELLKSPMRSSIISLSILIGAFTAQASMIRILYPWLENNSSGDPLAVSGIFSASNILLAVGLVGAVSLVAIYPAVMARTFDYIKGHIAILRVRGADKKSLINYVYISFLPSLLVLLISSVLTGLLFLVSMDSALGIAFIDSWNKEDFSMPHLLPYLQYWQLALVLSMVLFIFLLPAFLAFRVARVKDLARYLKEEVF